MKKKDIKLVLIQCSLTLLINEFLTYRNENYTEDNLNPTEDELRTIWADFQNMPTAYYDRIILLGKVLVETYAKELSTIHKMNGRYLTEADVIGNHIIDYMRKTN